MKIKILFSIFLLVFSMNSWASWHGGKVNQLNVGYDGETISFKLAGWSRTNCTCYSSWPDAMCLNKARSTHDFEKSILLSARAKNSKIYVNIDETTCSVTALYEITE